MYEKKSQRPIPSAAFAMRILRHVVGAAILVSLSLAAGVLGYMHFEDLPIIDAFLNSAMLLGGLGTAAPLERVSGKVFTALYALYAGVVFVAAAAIVVTPLAHRVLHKFHWDEQL